MAFEDAHDLNKLAEPLGSMMRYGVLKGPRVGHVLSLTSGVRSKDDQVITRRKNCGSTHYDIWDKPARLCSPPTAKPGTSNHQTGTAADMGNANVPASVSRAAKQWLYDELKPLGIARPVPGEDWHFEYRGTDPKGDLIKLGRKMEADGFTEAEIRQVYGTGNSSLSIGPVDRAGELGVEGQSSITIAGIRFRVPNPGTISGAADAVTGALGLDPLLQIGELFTVLTDPVWWKRVGTGAAGVAVVGLGLGLLGSDLALSAVPSITKGLVES